MLPTILMMNHYYSLISSNSQHNISVKRSVKLNSHKFIDFKQYADVLITIINYKTFILTTFHKPLPLHFKIRRINLWHKLSTFLEFLPKGLLISDIH